jgi:hypothetical protein
MLPVASALSLLVEAEIMSFWGMLILWLACPWNYLFFSIC